MNVERARVRIRERGRLEVLDLAFVFLRTNARAFAILSAVVVLPLSVLAWAVLGLLDEAAWWVQLYAAVVLYATLSAAVRAPVLLLAGQAMFVDPPTLARTRSEMNELAGPIAALIVRRFALAATLIGLPIHALTRYFLEEVLLLERVGRAATRSRLQYLRRKFGGDWGGQLFVHGFLGLAFVVAAWTAWVLAHWLFATDPETEIFVYPRSLGAWPLALGILGAQVYFAAGKFLYYLNLRTIHEGWDLFLETRAIRIELDRRRRRRARTARRAPPPRPAAPEARPVGERA